MYDLEQTMREHRRALRNQSIDQEVKSAYDQACQDVVRLLKFFPKERRAAAYSDLVKMLSGIC